MTPDRSPRDPPAWFIDELGYAGRENLDSAHVARYDAIEDAGADGEVALLVDAGLTRESVVVELGAGTGQFSVAVAGLRPGVAVDVSPPDFWKAVTLARVRRMLGLGGRLRLWDVVYDFAPAEVEERIEAWCAGYDQAGEGEWNRADLEEHVRDEHSTFTWLLEPMMRCSGFEIVDAEHTDDGIFALRTRGPVPICVPRPLLAETPERSPLRPRLNVAPVLRRCDATDEPDEPDWELPIAGRQLRCGGRPAGQSHPAR